MPNSESHASIEHLSGNETEPSAQEGAESLQAKRLASRKARLQRLPVNYAGVTGEDEDERLQNISELRKNIADQIKFGKKQDKDGWTPGRSWQSYESYLRGLDLLFEYIKTLSSHKILDIGAGIGHGVKGLTYVQRKDSSDLTFDATVLTGKIAHAESQFPEFKGDSFKGVGVKVYITPVDSMRTIPSNEYGGVISVFSVCYSAAPKLAVANIDRILVRGGVFKGRFALEGEDAVSLGAKTADPFVPAFRDRGYSVQVKDGVLLAVKPGAVITASELMQKDEELLPVKKDFRGLKAGIKFGRLKQQIQEAKDNFNQELTNKVANP